MERCELCRSINLALANLIQPLVDVSGYNVAVVECAVLLPNPFHLPLHGNSCNLSTYHPTISTRDEI
jgi:hypothetical protein